METARHPNTLFAPTPVYSGTCSLCKCWNVRFAVRPVFTCQFYAGAQAVNGYGIRSFCVWLLPLRMSRRPTSFRSVSVFSIFKTYVPAFGIVVPADEGYEQGATALLLLSQSPSESWMRLSTERASVDFHICRKSFHQAVTPGSLS